MQIWAGGEGELRPVEAGPRLQTPEAGGDAVVLFVLLLRIQSHESRGSSTCCLLPRAWFIMFWGKLMVHTTELVYLGFDAESTMYQLCDLAQVT